MNLLQSWRNWRNKPGRTITEDEAMSDADPFTEPVALEITDVFDLHAIPPKQVKAVVEEYLLQAHERGFSQVRLIHGKGTGAQRATVRAILSRSAFVLSYYDAPPTAGGWGATIAELTH
jgi:dsDNA-specific endonuclease/ATPase MutS2